MPNTHDDIKAQIRAVLMELSKEEQKLFTAVYRSESDHLSQKNPRITDELLKLVRQVIS